MHIFREIAKYKVATVILTIVMGVVGYLFYELISPTKLIVKAVGSITAVLQDPATLATEAASLQDYINDMFNRVSMAILACIELVFLAIGVTALFLSHLSRQILDHDLKISHFEKQLEAYEKRGSAIIPYEDNPKRSFFHAKILDFYSPDKYDNGTQHDESIDFLNQAEYQNLILSPTYLEYLFRRRKQADNSIKVVVVSIVDEGLSAYLALCILAGYEVYIIDNLIFNTCIDKLQEYCGKEIVTIMNGNPFFSKNGEVISGKYEASELGEIKERDINGNNAKQIWNYLVKIIRTNANRLSETQETRKGILLNIIDSQKKRLVALGPST